MRCGWIPTSKCPSRPAGGASGWTGITLHSDQLTGLMTALAIGVAILRGGGPSAIYGSEALMALEQFEATVTN